MVTNLVASGLEGGFKGLHGLYGALVRVVEEEDAAILDAGEEFLSTRSSTGMSALQS